MEHLYGHDDKRRRIISPVMQQGNMVENVHHLVPPVHYNPPLGLKLEITPSLLELIGMDRGRDKTGKPVASSETNTSDHMEGISFVSETAEVIHKVSYFPVSLLKIGNWEYHSRIVGDLVGKFFFNKHALVWEVLDAGMMNRIEIKWTDVKGLKADCPQRGHSCLTIILGTQPHFFRAAIPQHRNHPVWLEISDFTNGEASLNRVHILQCPQGTLQQHFERLVQFDMHLNRLSQQPAIVLDSPYFGTRHSSVSNELHHSNRVCDSIKGGEPSLGPVFPDATSPLTPSAVHHPSFFQIEQQDLSSGMLEQLPQEPIFQNSDVRVGDGSKLVETGQETMIKHTEIPWFSTVKSTYIEHQMRAILLSYPQILTTMISTAQRLHVSQSH